MRRRSRSRSGSPVSLFAFQDIMMSVMGMMILVTLLMALELTVTVAASNPEPQLTDLGTDPAMITELRQRLDQLHEDYNVKVKEMVYLTDAAGGKGGDIKLARARLLETYEQIRELNGHVAQYRNALGDTRAKADTAGTKRQQIAEFRQRATRLQAMIDSERKNPRLTYIIQQGQGKLPVLIELSETTIGIGSTSDEQPAIWLTDPDHRLRMNQFSAWIRVFNMEQNYFVLLVKPSAFGTYMQFKTELENAGFDVGTDLIEESEVVLSRPNTAR